MILLVATCLPQNSPGHPGGWTTKKIKLEHETKLVQQPVHPAKTAHSNQSLRYQPEGGLGLQSVEALNFTTELHTSSIQVRVQPGTKYLYGNKICWNVCGLAVAFRSRWIHRHILGMPRYVWLSSTSDSPGHNIQQ